MLLSCLEKEDCIDEIHFWENTKDKEDLEFIRECEHSIDKAKIIKINARYGRERHERVSLFFHFYAKGFDDNTVFLKIDDDVIWMEEGTIESIAKFTIDNPQYVIVQANVINSPMIDHLHYRLGIYPDYKDFITWDESGVGWHDAELAELKHCVLLKNIENSNIDKYRFSRWECHGERVSINLICWNHNSFRYLDIDLGGDEHDLTVRLPGKYGRKTCIFGEKIASHLAFYKQIENGFNEDGILTLYEEMYSCK